MGKKHREGRVTGPKFYSNLKAIVQPLALHKALMKGGVLAEYEDVTSGPILAAH